MTMWSASAEQRSEQFSFYFFCIFFSYKKGEKALHCSKRNSRVLERIGEFLTPLSSRLFRTMGDMVNANDASAGSKIFVGGLDRSVDEGG